MSKFVFKLMLLVLRGDEQGLGVKINRIVLQTLTFTFGTFGIAPANQVLSFYQTVDTGII